MSTCRVFVVSFVDAIDGLLFQPVCPGCSWEGEPTANHQVAKARMTNHTTQGDGEK